MLTDDVLMDFVKMAKAVLSDAQRELLESQPVALREAVYRRIEESLRLSARLQMQACCGSGINPVILERVINDEQRKLEADAKRYDGLVRMLRGGASFALLRSLYAIDKTTFSKMRVELDVATTANRKKIIDESVSVALYREWEKLDRSTTTVETLLHLHDFCGESIHVIWGLLQDWEQVRAMVKRGRH